MTAAASHPIAAMMAGLGWGALVATAVGVLAVPDKLRSTRIGGLLALALVSQVAYLVGAFRFFTGAASMNIWRRGP